MRILALSLVGSLLTFGCSPPPDEGSSPRSTPVVTDDGASPGTPVGVPANVAGPWRLVFASEGAGRRGLDVYSATVPSGEPRLLAGIDVRDDFSPSLSPDGRWLAYRRNPFRGDEGDIYLASIGGGKQLNLTHSPGVADWSPSWSPSGEEIAFFSNEMSGLDIWVMNRDGSDKRRLTDDPALDEYPTWSPDGDRLAFQSTRESGFDIYVMGSDGQDPTNITRHPSEDKWAAWSPDGEWIAFVSERDGSDDVFVCRPDGSDARNLTATPDLQESHPAWLPNGTLTFSRHGERGPISVWAVPVEGGPETQIETSAEPVFTYGWGPVIRRSGPAP